MTRQLETSAALQTPPGKGGIAVIALAGPDVGRILAAVFRPLKSHAQTGPDVIRLGHLVADGRCIDEAVVHQREGFAEINIHGGPAAARAAMELLAKHGARIVASAPAETFQTAHPRHNNPAVGREMLEHLPLAASSLVAAALTQQWSAGISELAAGAVRSPGPASRLAEALRDASGDLETMTRLLTPPEVVIAGPPNVGKSALANALVGRQVSIVDESAGTTRDWVRELTLFWGVPVWLTDTAGLWEPPLPVDAEAVRRARHRAENADLVLLLGASRRIEVPPWLHARNVLKVSSKCDILAPAGNAEAAVASLTGQGLDELREKILVSLHLDAIDPARAMAFTQRQADLLARAADAIEAGDADLARQQLGALLKG